MKGSATQRGRKGRGVGWGWWGGVVRADMAAFVGGKGLSLSLSGLSPSQSFLVLRSLSVKSIVVPLLESIRLLLT